jgi:hypothetical protein
LTNDTGVDKVFDKNVWLTIAGCIGGPDMEESNKKPIMIGVIVVCAVVAVGITVLSRSTIPADKMVWLKCRVGECEAEREVTLRDYYYMVEEKQKEIPGMPITPPLVCHACGEDSVYKAAKCAKCGLVFETGWKRGDFEDRCPKPECGYSQIEVDRKEAHEARKKSK